MDAVIDPSVLAAGGSTTDLIKRGLFYIRGYDIPTEEDLRKARARMEKWYRQCIADAQALARVGKQNEITAEMHLAADHFKVRESWHAVLEAPGSCPNCGADIKPGIAFHSTSEGKICVIDWKRTVEAGAKTLQQVPESLKWWGSNAKEG